MKVIEQKPDDGCTETFCPLLKEGKCGSTKGFKSKGVYIQQCFYFGQRKEFVDVHKSTGTLSELVEEAMERGEVTDHFV